MYLFESTTDYYAESPRRETPLRSGGCLSGGLPQLNIRNKFHVFIRVHYRLLRGVPEAGDSASK